MKRFLSALLAVFMIATLICVPTFAEGEATIEADISWYSANTSASEFYIKDAGDLLGLAQLCNNKNNTINGQSVVTNFFAGKTVYLAADIDMNPGKDLSVTVNDGVITKSADLSDTDLVNFPGIRLFRGNLDGQGYTISNLYMSHEIHQGGDGNGWGFVGKVDQSLHTFKNLSIVDSCIFTTNTTTNGTGDKNFGYGGFLAYINNGNTTVEMENIYLDIDVVSTKTTSAAEGMVGGVIGRVNQAKQINLTSVVFAGQMITQNTAKADTQVKDVLNVSQMIGGAPTSNCVFLTNCAMNGTIHSGNSESWGEGAARINPVNLMENGVASAQGTQNDTADFVYSKVAGAVVPATVAAMLNHNAWAQTGTITVGEEQVKALRILTGLENLDWAEVSYTVTVGEKTESTDPITTVYESVTAAGEDVAASELNANYEYLYGVVIKNIPDNCTLTVTPVVTTAKDTVVTLHSFTVEVVNGEVAE